MTLITLSIRRSPNIVFLGLLGGKSGRIRDCNIIQSAYQMQPSTVLSMYSATPILMKPKFSSGVNQFGLKPVNHMDFMVPSMLVNYGRGTTIDTLDVRRTPSGKKSAPSLDGLAVTDQLPKMLGLVRNDYKELHFCSSETAGLRICMAKGTSSCEREYGLLQMCLERVQPLRSAITRAGSEWRDWFIQNVSDNYTKPCQHRPHDHIEQRNAHLEQRFRAQGGRAFGKHPKKLAWGVRSLRQPGSGMARFSRLPVNK